MFDETIKIQSVNYGSNFSAFFRDVKPPFFEDYDIEIVDGTDNCYDSAI